MSEYAQREFEAYRADDSAIRAILDRAAEEKRSTSAEEDEQLDKLWESATGHKRKADKLISQADEAVEMDKLAEAVRSRIGGGVDDDSGNPPGGDKGGDLMEAIRAAQDHIAGNADASFGERVFSHAPDPSVYSKPLDEAVEEVRAIANFSDGGKLWIADFATRVAVYQRTASPWFNIASIITADNGRDGRYPQLTADPTSFTPGEGTAITDADPTLGTATLTTSAYKALGYISAEAEEDEVIGYIPLLTRVQGRSVGHQAGSAFTAKIITDAANGGTATGTGGVGTSASPFFGYEDLIDLKMGRAEPYRGVGVFVASNVAIRKIRKFRDAQGAYFYQSSSAPGQPAVFDGNPIYEDPYLAAPASATKSVLFGDPQSVLIKQVPLRVAISTEFRFATDQVAIKTVHRAGAIVWDVPGIAFLVSANT